MSNDMEEFEETAPEEAEESSRGRVIVFAILVYAFIACAAYFFFYQLSPANLLDTAANEEAAANIVSPYPAAAYLVPENDLLLTPAQMAMANLQPVNDSLALATLLGNEPSITTIYIHPAMLIQGETAIIKQQYNTGRLLVALNTPLSTLAAALDVTPTQPDLPLEEFVNGTAVAAMKQRNNGPPLEFVATYAQFEQIPATLAGLR